MSDFILTDTNRYFLNVSNAPKRFLHIATITRTFFEYVVILDKGTGKMHLNDITTGTPEIIEDENLYQELMGFVSLNKLTVINQGAKGKDLLFNSNVD